MAANNIIFYGESILNLTETTAVESDVAQGKIFFKADGTKSVGTAQGGGGGGEYFPELLSFYENEQFRITFDTENKEFSLYNKAQSEVEPIMTGGYDRVNNLIVFFSAPDESIGFASLREEDLTAYFGSFSILYPTI